MSVGVGATPSTVPISSARSGWARPEKSIRVFRFSALMLFIAFALPVRSMPARPSPAAVASTHLQYHPWPEAVSHQSATLRGVSDRLR